ncbi:casein kinase I-like protein isoform X1 [Tanacetum coccineum]|uniref:Casein kinase I-like protein isoform X1 n=1 Tax=Tanacetum coccineum TaxID=301880 RepID=A0ABQ5EWW7_9ASTR
MSANDDFSLHDDEELSLHDDASLAGSVPASNKGDAPAKPPQIITSNTLSNIKLPVLQKDDYDTWHSEMDCKEFQGEREQGDLLLMKLAKINSWQRCPKCKFYVDRRDGYNEVWKVIQNGNSKKRVTKGKDGVYRVLPPTTQEEQSAGENKGQREGKAPMLSEETPKKTKEQI